MKVLFIIDTLEGYGAEKSIVQIALNFKEVQPVFVHLFSGSKLKGALENNGIKVYSLNFRTTLFYTPSIEVITKIIKKEKPQIIHSTLFRSNMLARKLKNKFPGISIINSLVSNSYSGQRYKTLSALSKLKLFTTQFRDRVSVNEADFFVCNSEAIKNPNIKALGIAKEKIRVIHRGRLFENLIPLREKVRLLKQTIGIKNETIFLNVSRLKKSKGQLDLIKAFHLFHQRDNNSFLIIAGEGEYRKVLENEIQKLKLNKNILLLGYCDNIPEILELADFFVFPTYYEGLPGALIEAIIAKKPCIVSNIAENKECFPKEGALFFPPGNVNLLIRKMEEAVQLENWEQKTAKSYSYAKENFEITLIAQQYEDFYQQIIENR